MSTSVLKARSRVALKTRQNDPAGVAEARRDLAAAKIEQYVQRVVAEAPPLTDAQRSRIVSILQPVAGGAQ